MLFCIPGPRSCAHFTATAHLNLNGVLQELESHVWRVVTVLGSAALGSRTSPLYISAQLSLIPKTGVGVLFLLTLIGMEQALSAAVFLKVRSLGGETHQRLAQEVFHREISAA